MHLDPQLPFKTAQVPFFYGWVILVVGTLGVVATIPGQTMGAGPFTESLLEALELSRDELALAYLVGTIGSGLLLPRIGRWFDVVGARLVSVLAFLGFGLALLALSQVGVVYRAVAAWVAPEGRAFWVGWSLIVVGYFLIRFLGQGTITMVCRAMIGKWFNRQRGIVSALSGAVTSGLFAISPAYLLGLIQILGYEGAWLALGAVMILGMAPLSYLFFRDNPEECGLLMDDPAARRADATGPSDPEFTIYREMTGPEARRTYAYWLFCAGPALMAFFGTAIPFHAESIAIEVGMSSKEFYQLFVAILPVQIGATFLTGWLCGRTKMKWTLMIMIGGGVMAAWGLTLLPGTLGLILYVGGQGLGWGAFGPISTVTFPRFFGRQHLGETSGGLMVAMVLASAFGPYVFALVKTGTGSYQSAALAFCLIGAAALVMSLRAENPQRALAPGAK